LGLHDLFDGVVTFDDVGIAKPRPELFLQAARCLALPPPQCLVFEDSPQGIEAGRRAGMTVVDVAQLLSVALPAAVGVAGHLR
jgi:HAD superfamily hydrolase (TIGR01509 family)